LPTLARTLLWILKGEPYAASILAQVN
jgi:hypothetical protein